MVAPEGDNLRNLRECIRAFDQTAAHTLNSLRELLLAGRSLFDVAIENTTTSPITADAWIEAIPPGGTAVPLMVRTDVTFPASATITRPDLTQNVPASAPPGVPLREYSNWPGYLVGSAPHTLWAQVDSFGAMPYGIFDEPDEGNNILGPVAIP